MPDPVSEALQPAFAFAPLRRGQFGGRRSARPPSPGSNGGRGLRLRPRSVRTGRKRPILPAWRPLEKTSLSETIAFAVGRCGASPVPPFRENASGSKANLAIPPHPLRSPRTEANPGRCATGPSTRSKLLAWARSQPRTEARLRSIRRRIFGTRSKLLVLNPSRHSPGANSVPLPPDLSPESELPDTGPFATWRQGEPCIFRRRIIRSGASPRTSILRSLKPKQAPILPLPDRTRESKSPSRPVSRTSGSKRTSILPPPDLAHAEAPAETRFGSGPAEAFPFPPP